MSNDLENSSMYRKKYPEDLEAYQKIQIDVWISAFFCWQSFSSLFFFLFKYYVSLPYFWYFHTHSHIKKKRKKTKRRNIQFKEIKQQKQKKEKTEYGGKNSNRCENNNQLSVLPFVCNMKFPFKEHIRYLLYLCPFIFFIFNAWSNIRTTNPRHYRSSITTLHVSRRRARKKIRQRTDMHAVLADTALFCEHARLYTEKKKSAGVKMKRIGGDARERMTER